MNWKEEAWENFLKKFWDNRADGVSIVGYTKEDVEKFLKKYTRSGQGEIRIFHYGHEKVGAVKKRRVSIIAQSRNSWALVLEPKRLVFKKPTQGGDFTPKTSLTEGMLQGVRETFNTSANPGETTLLAIANHIGLISDFYGLESRGVIFTGGRQRAGVHIVINGVDLDISQAQIEIDGGLEWDEAAVIVEMKSSFSQEAFSVKQAFVPLLKWQKLLSAKKVYSMVLLAETIPEGIEYWAYDLVPASNDSVDMNISKSKRYSIAID